MSETSKIVDEHFWFTATTLGFNAVVISSDEWANYRSSVIILSGIISVFAIFLIVDRFAAYAGRLGLSERPKEVPNKKFPFKEFGKLSLFRFKWFIPNLILAIAECSGSLFYITLVVVSWIGVLFSK